MGFLGNTLQSFALGYIGWITISGGREEKLFTTLTGYRSGDDYKFTIDDISEIKFVSKVGRLPVRSNGENYNVQGNKYAVTFTDGKKAIISVDELRSNDFDQKCYL